MSVDYRPLSPISFCQLFDRELEDTGVRQHFNEKTTSKDKCLTDGQNFVWVWSDDEEMASFTVYGSNRPQCILQAIADKFGVSIVSEHEPQYWGFDTHEEWDAELEKESEEYNKEFYNDIVNFISGKPNSLEHGTVGMEMAKVAKRVTAERPELLSDKNQDELLRMVKTLYYQGSAVEEAHPLVIELEEIVRSQLLAGSRFDPSTAKSEQ
jgi:hypothetical protein